MDRKTDNQRVKLTYSSLPLALKKIVSVIICENLRQKDKQWPTK